MSTRKKEIAQSLEKANVAESITDDEFLEDDQSEGRFLLFNVMPSWVFSFVVHVALILLMAFLVMPSIENKSVAFEASESVSERMETIDLNLDADLDVQEDVLESEISEEEFEIFEEVTPEMEVEVAMEEFADVDLASEIFETADEFGESAEIGAVNETVSRSSAESRERLVKEYGGNSASEEAVALALEWIVKHQLPDGGWSFDHRIGDGKFRNSPNPGVIEYEGARLYARNGATAMALLPLLGQGHTHLAGKYKKEVRRGIEYLMQKGQPQKSGSISYYEPGGRFYSHGLCSIVFTEAFAMSQDPLLAPYAQGCLWYLEQTQHPSIGGWKYIPFKDSDTSVVGWQVMAFKSGKLSGLQINKKTYKLIDKFLNYVSTDAGTFYGYDTPEKRRNKSCTAVGILCRMYMGWDKEHPSLNKAVKFLSDTGPLIGKKKPYDKDSPYDKDNKKIPDDEITPYDMYYNYYGTQVMKQYGGEEWTNWNEVMRDSLVEKQDKTGIKAGSWFFNHNHATNKGGRLYCTAMACMTLEVYYRYLPLYGQDVTEDEFPLD